MNADEPVILRNLDAVGAERRRRLADPVLSERVRALKAYQHERFAHTYADLLSVPRYAAATEFFLDDLYGPHDFTDRDAQFARVVPALVRLFPAKVVRTVRSLSTLHALSEELDTLMSQQLSAEPINARSYEAAWCAVGREDDRMQQIDLMLEIGAALEGYTNSKILGRTLRLMRVPARKAGLSSLQVFLERGFEAFRAIGGAQEFLNTIASRERELAKRLFSNSPPAAEASPVRFP